MLDVLFEELERKYGEDFNWALIDFTNKYFIEEAEREIKQGHPLYGEIINSIAKCDSNDDVLYVISGERYAIIHLTYCGNSDVTYPRFTLFNNVEEGLIYIEKRYLLEYL